jgi:hypothetical protein
MASGNMFLTGWNYLDADPFSDVQAATLSGSNWLESGDCSLSNLQTRFLRQPARVVNVAEPGVVRVVFDRPRLIQCIALLGITCSTQAQVRAVGYDDAACTVPHAGADTGPQLLFPRYTATEALPFEAPNWWTGQPTAEMLARITRTWFHLLDRPRFCRAWEITIDDQGNTSGFWDIGQLMLAPIFQARVNFLYGSSYGWQTRTGISYAKGGTAFADYQPPYRAAALQVQHLSPDEAHLLLNHKSRMGTDRHFFCCLSPHDVQYRQLLSFRCRFSALTPMTWTTINLNGFETINLEEDL